MELPLPHLDYLEANLPLEWLTYCTNQQIMNAPIAAVDEGSFLSQAVSYDEQDSMLGSLDHHPRHQFAIPSIAFEENGHFNLDFESSPLNLLPFGMDDPQPALSSGDSSTFSGEFFNMGSGTDLAVSDSFSVDAIEESEAPSSAQYYEVLKSSSPKKRTHSALMSPNIQKKRAKVHSTSSILHKVHEEEADAFPKHHAGSSIRGKKEEPLSRSSKQGKKVPTNAQNFKESKWAQHLLKACASAIANNNLSRTQHLMWVLNDLASFTGDANQRLAACGLKALFSRITGSVSLLPTLPLSQASNSCPDTTSTHRACLKFQDVSPWHKCAYTIANGAIVEACEGHDIIHVVDIGVSQGTQWPTLIEALASRPSGMPKLLRLTMIENGNSSANMISRLGTFATRLGLNLKLKTIAAPLESLSRKELEMIEGEALIVCLQFRLHSLSDSISKAEPCKSSKRDQVLQKIHRLKPNLLVLSENDVDHCSPDFFTRFQRAMEFQWSFLDSTCSSFQGQESEEREIVEAEASMAFMNIVAFEEDSRTERNEAHKAWSSRARKAGFSSYLPGAQVLESAKSLLRKHSGDWNMLVEDGVMVLRWKGNPTTFCSIWRCHFDQ